MRIVMETHILALKLNVGTESGTKKSFLYQDQIVFFFLFQEGNMMRLKEYYKNSDKTLLPPCENLYSSFLNIS